MSDFEELFTVCINMAKEISDGHFTLCRYTSNWRAGFLSISERFDHDHMAAGNTPEEAMTKAIERRVTYMTDEQRAKIRAKYGCF